jgi:hypothetical protein
MSAIQRTFTFDDYDHVALVLRYSNSELYLFEATYQIVN